MNAAVVLASLSVLVAGGLVRRLQRAGPASLARRRVQAPVAPAGSSPSSPDWWAGALERAGLEVDPHRTWRAWWFAVVAPAGLAAVVGGPGAAVLVLVVGAGAPPAALWALRERGDERLEASLPGLLEVAAAGLRSGASLTQALGEAGRRPGLLATELASMVAAVEHGAPLVAELDRWAERRPLPGLRLAVAALALGARTGGAQAKAVDGVAQTLRDRAALRREVSALSSQARASAGVMAAVPVLFAALASASDPRAAAFLFRDPLGLACLVLGLALDAIAGLWMIRLTRSDP